MKIKHLLTTLFASLSALALTSGAVQAQTPLSYANGDVFLGFRASGGTGVAQCYMVKLGQLSQFTAGGSAFTVPGLGNIGADLVATFGATWNTRPDVLWSVSGSPGIVAVGSDPARSLYASREQSPAGTPSAGWTRAVANTQGPVASKMSAMGNAYSATAGVTNMSTANSPVGYLQNTGDANSYASYMPGGTVANSGPAPGISFAYFNPTIEGTFTSGVAGSVLDFVQLRPGAGAGPIVGTFSIANDGTLTYTPASGSSNANVHFTLATYSGSEAIAGQQISIGITRDGNTGTAASVNFSTSDGTALAGTDYTAQSNIPVNFAASETTKNILVDVVHRPGFQGNRNFNVTLSSPGAGTTITTPNPALVTILEADPDAGAISFTAATFQGNEVDAQSAPNVIPVTFTRSGGTTGAVDATLSVVAGGTLTEVTDFNLASSTVSFANGVNSATVNINLNAIAPAKIPGTINLALSNATGGATIGATAAATVTVNNVPANVHFTNAVNSISETAGHIDVSITRDGNTAKPFTVNFSTSDGTAVAPTDYTSQTNTVVTFAAGDTTKTVPVDIVNRATFQGNRAFGVSLTGPSTGAAVTAPATASVNILESDPVPAGVIAFDAAVAPALAAKALNGTNTPNTIPLTFKRTNGTSGAVTVDLTVTGGTLVNGTDYDPIPTPKQISFADTVDTATFNVQLKTIAPNKLPGTIQLTLSNATNGATLGGLTTTTITVTSNGIIALSAAKYKFNPVNNQAQPNDLAITLNRASGVNGAVDVTFATTGGSLVSGTDFDAPNATVHFNDGAATATAHIQLNAIAAAKLPGTINISVSNPTGGATVFGQTTAIITILKPDLVLPTVTVTAPAAGSIVTSPFTLTGKATDANGVDRVEVKLNGGLVQLATLGTPTPTGTVKYTLVGLVPENGKNTLAITAVDTSGNKSVTFNLVVNYVNNRPELAGGYNGLLVPAVTPSNGNSGLVKISVTAAGTFTGNATLGGFVVPFSGVVGNDGKAHFKPKLLTTLALAGKSPTGTPVPLGTLEMTVATDLVLEAKTTGTLKDANSAVIADLDMPRNFFNAKDAAHTVDIDYTDPAQNKGKFTLVFPSKAQGAMPTTDFAQGDGYANLTLTAAGAVSVTGKLADGVAFTASAKLAKDYTWPLYAKLFGGKGSAAGLATFDKNQALSDLSAPNVLWFRPAKPTSKYYPHGWTGGILVDVLGAKYIKTVGASVLPSLGPTDPAAGNATLVFADGKLVPSPLSKNLNIDPNNVVTNAPATDKSFLLTIVKGTGQISGNFKHTDATKPLFNGIIYQKGINAGGYGFFLSTVPATPGATGESGGVSLSAK